MQHDNAATFGRGWRRMTAGLADLGGLALVVMMAVTVADIVGRNLGLFYLQGVIEISNVTVVFLGFIGLAHCFNVGGQIVVDLATMNAPPRLNRLLDSAWLLVAAMIYLVMAWLMWGEGMAAQESGAVSDNLEWSPLTFFAPAVLGALVTALTCLWLAISGLRELAEGD
jgi:TRAP-type transport system small permease protein